MENSSLIPEDETPGGKGLDSSMTNRRLHSFSGNEVSAATEYTRLELNKMRPALRCLQYSSRFTVPHRLCSTSWRLLDLPSTPARTLGLAAASRTQSADGKDSKSL